ncbi:MAG: hypothetical protein HYZ14_07310 [Bacteroidetes bacterium]|nr:hypothetical protein [Bacteroidota bacterium]
MKQVNAQKIADTTTTLPNSDNPFIAFYAPCYNGKELTFYGNNETMEGIYFVDSTKSVLELVKVSDNQTSIPALAGPPTTNQDPNNYKDAYVSYAGGIVVQPPTGLSVPRPMAMKDGVAFFAANQLSGAAGIFFYAYATGIVSNVVNNTVPGVFLPASVNQPSATVNTVYFSATGEILEPTGKMTPPPGVYFSTNNGMDAPKMVFDLTMAKTTGGNLLTDIGSCKISVQEGTESIVYLYGSFAGANTLLEDGIYAFSMGTFQRTLPIGKTFGSYTVPQSGAYAEISLEGNLLAFQTCLNDTDQNPWDTVMALLNGTPVLIQVLYGNIPGNSGTYTGNAVQLATDGTRVAFASTYEPQEGFGERTGLFVWNSTTQKLSAALLDKDELDGKKFSNISLSTSSFKNGKLAAVINFYDGSSGVYLIDLSSY